MGAPPRPGVLSAWKHCCHSQITPTHPQPNASCPRAVLAAACMRHRSFTQRAPRSNPPPVHHTAGPRTHSGARRRPTAIQSSRALHTARARHHLCILPNLSARSAAAAQPAGVAPACAARSTLRGPRAQPDAPCGLFEPWSSDSPDLFTLPKGHRPKPLCAPAHRHPSRNHTAAPYASLHARPPTHTRSHPHAHARPLARRHARTHARPQPAHITALRRLL